MLIKTLITATVLSLGVSAFAAERWVTPYGDYCRDCTTYGICKSMLQPQEAMAAIESYYRDKGYHAGRFYIRGRFIEAYIFENNRLVDRVIFDRKTGRLRSIF